MMEASVEENEEQEQEEEEEIIVDEEFEEEVEESDDHSHCDTDPDFDVDVGVISDVSHASEASSDEMTVPVVNKKRRSARIRALKVSEETKSGSIEVGLNPARHSEFFSEKNLLEKTKSQLLTLVLINL